MNEKIIISNINNDIEVEIPATAIVDVNKSQLIHGEKSIKEEVFPEKNELLKFEDSVLNIRVMCRACLSIEKNMISLFVADSSESLADMFHFVSSLKIDPKEHLPVQVCKSCQIDILKYYNFKLKCIKTNKFLRSFLETEHGSKDIFVSYLKESEVKSVDIKNLDASKITDDEHYNYLKEPEEVKSDDLRNRGVCKMTDDVYFGYIKEQRDQKLDLKNEEKYMMTHDVEDIEYLEEEILLNDEIFVMPINSENVKKQSANTFRETNRISKKIVKNGKNKKRNKHLECSVCYKIFFTPKSLDDHVKQNHNIKMVRPFPCKHCKEYFNSEHDLHLHSALHDVKNNTWVCNKCNKQFTVKNGLRRHIRRHMEWKRYSCESCGKAFAELCSLRRHVRVHTGERPEKKFVCDVCNKRFIDRTQLATHAAFHTGESACSCEQCGKAFRSRRLLASHRRIHSDSKPFACDYCPKRFRHESTRNTHHRTHTGEKPYVCSICGKTFIQQSNLTLHTRTHTGEKPYTCDVCGRKFSSGSSLTCHRRTHTGEKPYGCPVCGKKFARTDIQTHLRLHTGERPFACCACPKSFASASRLRDHRLMHTGEKAFECAICSEKYKRKSYLARHLKWHAADWRLKKGEVHVVQSVRATGDDVGQEDAAEVNVPQSAEHVPLDVTQELILDDSDVKNEVVVVDEGPHSIGFQSGEVCLDAQDDYEDQNDVIINEDDVSDSALVEGPPVRLYQMDQSLVQIETRGGQMTIRKITSKMTANF